MNNTSSNNHTINHIDILEQARGYAQMARTGLMSYEDAKREALPLLQVVNARGKDIAKKYGKRFMPITFTGLVR
jgi:hypothetical protein